MARSILKLTLELRRPKDLLERVLPNGQLGGLVLEGTLPSALGTRVPLTVRFAEPAERHFKVEVQLAWVRHKGSAALNLKEGYGVDFVAEDTAGRDRLLAYAREELATASSRSDVRIFTNLPVKIRHDGRVRKESLIDLSEGGAFVRTGMFLPVGAVLDFAVRPPRSLRSIRVRGRVAWLRKTGDARGFGVEFVYDDPRQAIRVRKLVERLG